MQAFHVTIVTAGRLPMFLEEGPRRAALHVLGRIFPKRLVVFAVVDDHVHLVVFATPEEVGLLARDLVFGLTPLASVALEQPHIAPVTDDRHMRSLVRYSLEQFVHHGIGEHPAISSGSCYPEMVGARTIHGLELQLERAFPREGTRPDPAPIVGLPSAPLAPASLLAVRRLGAYRLGIAAAFAAGTGGLPGLDPVNVAARRAAAHLGMEAEIDNGELAFALGMDRNTVRRLQSRAADPALVLAIRTRLALEQAAAVSCRNMAIQSMAEAVARRKDGLKLSQNAAATGPLV